MVEVTKDYVFDGPEGTIGLLDLFDGRRQLLVYHFMFDPEWDEGCTAARCDRQRRPPQPPARARHELALVSRAPLRSSSLQGERMGWTCPGTPPTAATSTTTSTSRWTRRSPRSNTTSKTRPSSSARTRLEGLGGRATGRQRVSPRRGARVPHVLHLRPRHRPARRHLQLARSDRARSSGGLGATSRAAATTRS